MITRGSGRASRRPRPVVAVALGLVAAGLLASCGSKSFPNDPRPPAPIDVTAKVDSKRVVVSPNRFGAGLVTFTVANLSNTPVDFTISGVSGAQKSVSSGVIEPGAPGSLKVNLKQGSYRATAGHGVKAAPATVTVGPERKTSQNELLQP
jgi:hypothetical protein